MSNIINREHCKHDNMNNNADILKILFVSKTKGELISQDQICLNWHSSHTPMKDFFVCET